MRPEPLDEPTQPESARAGGDGRDSEARFRALFDQAAVGMVEFDVEGRILRTNETFCRIVGRSKSEIIGFTTHEYTHPADRGLAIHYIREIESRHALRASFEKRYIRPDGAAIWARATLSPLFDEGGQLSRLLGIIEDISEQKSAEDRIRFLMLVSDVVRPLTDPDEITSIIVRMLGEHMEVDRCAYAEIGPDQDTMFLTGSYTRGVQRLRGELKLSDFGTEVLDRMRANQPYVVYDIDSHWPAVDVGIYRRIDIHAVICVPLHKAGRLVGTMAVHQRTPRIWTADEVQLVQVVAARCWESIERARIARHLRESEQRYRTLVDNISAVVWLSDATGQFTSDNPSWSAFTGQAFDEYRGFGWLQAVHPDDQAHTLERWEAAVNNREAFEVEHRLRRHDGEYRYVVTRGAPVLTPDGQVKEWVGNCTDNHAERLLLEQNKTLLASERSAREEAERTGRMKDEFLATLSHELRTPLSAILGWSQLMQRAPMSADELREGLATIERNARAQAQLIEDLLDMSRIISGKIHLNVQTINLPTVVAAAIATVKHSAAAKRIQVHTSIDPQAGPITGDPNRIQQCVWNLLSNSIKFTPSGGTVTARLQRLENQVEISVSDTGVGIAPEFLPHVFERFRQADASTTRRHGGLGLGLAIVKQLVELHGGSISVHSQGVGQGSTFVIRLPLPAVLITDEPVEQLVRTDESGILSTQVERWTLPDLEGLCVMVVDDEQDARELARRVLIECRADVVVAKNGREALRMLLISPPEILVSDIGMPEIDGYELIRQARARGYTAPAVALTAFARTEDREQALAAGFQKHIAKPLDPRELATTVARLTGRHSSA
jgi:PAS domain S-box-containing protein